MMNNLEIRIKKENDLMIKKKTRNKFEIYINDVIFLNNRKILEFYVVLYSYLKSRYLVIREILMVKKLYRIEYRNMNFMMNFSYIDFKIWIIKNSNLSDSQNGSSLLDYEYEKEISFEISLVDGCLDALEEKMGSVENLKPKIPLIRQELLKEILGDVDELLCKNEQEN